VLLTAVIITGRKNIMRKWTVILLVLAALGSAAPAAAQESTPPAAPDIPAVCRSAVEGMAALTADLAWPDHLMQENAAKTADDFDVNAYFTVLNHLSVQEGLSLDYVYQFDFMGGYPVLYTLPVDQEPFATFADYKEAASQTHPEVASYNYPSYLDQIVIDDTPEGYMQMAVLDVMGAQFYLFWHAGYNDFQIICDNESLETLVASENQFGQPLPEDVEAQARQIDVTPTVELDGDVARVQVIGFTNWGGFYRVTFTTSRAFPRDVYEIETENVVSYNCGVMF
jgi:hypothetical protein